ncbi:hypothetical protein, partial [Halopseudomonas bauzanensis]|uniref:hypothetical protein n=1 Tax=Halopseudomonas bauzanensis TaxID=653930 RepID=UPI002554BCAA
GRAFYANLLICQAFFVRLFSAALPGTSAWNVAAVPGQGGAFYRSHTPCQRLPCNPFHGEEAMLPTSSVSGAFYAVSLACQPSSYR